MAPRAKIRAGSHQPGFEAEKVVDGVARPVGGDSHQWRSVSLRPEDAWLELDFGRDIGCSQLHLSFDTNLSRHMTLTHQDSYHARMIEGPQPETVKDYRIEAFDTSGWKVVESIKGNYQRKKVHSFAALRCRKLRIAVSGTNGIPEARIFEVRCYE